MPQFIRSDKKEFAFLKVKTFSKNKKSFINFKRHEEYYSDNEDINSSWIRVMCKTENSKATPDIIRELEEIVFKHSNTRITLKAINTMYTEDRLDFYIELRKSFSKVLYKNYYKIARFVLKCTILDSVNIPAVLPENWKNVIMEVLNRRFSNNELTGESIIDLSNFCKDALLKEQGLFMKLSNPNVMKHVITMLKQTNLKSLTKINFGNNEISNTFQMQTFFSQCNVTEVDFSYNRLSRTSDLEFLSKNNVTSLNIVNNDFLKKMNPKKLQDEIRKLLPKLILLNGSLLPASIVIAGEIPSTKKDFPELVFSDKNSDVHTAFVLKYCQAFDNITRDDLLDFYSTESVMTLSCYTDELPYGYRTMNSNLKSRNNAIIYKKGKAEISAAFTSFPKTKHIFETLNVDIAFRTVSDMMFILTGVFIELPEKNKKYRPREFSRTFVISNGIILQEHLAIMSNNANLFNKFKNEVDKLIERNDFTEKYRNELNNLNPEAIAIVKQFKSFSGMSIKACLEFLSFANNLTEAIEKFTLMKEQGNIPNEAYDRT